ncbi:PTS sugar transporter subunit IIA [Enterococcus sp. DIV0800]|uniref:PTS sugar transporter subunit IIA n=1 Tax=unclassified Enterococcus TaxID=2608891 RepID=UPI003D3009D8
MFHIFGKKPPVLIDDPNVYSPVDGKIISIEETSDSVFASKAMGDGFAVIPSHETIKSPVAGKVVLVATTKHAIGLKMKNGNEVLVHMGVDTVDLDGEPFSIKVQVGDVLEGGQVLGTMDLSLIEKQGLATDVIVVFTNSEPYSFDAPLKTGIKVAGELVTTLKMKKEQYSND